MTKIIAVLAVAAGAVTFSAQPVAAQECTEAYEKCLNDTWHLEGWAQTMADLECFAKWVGCVGDQLEQT